VLTGDTSETTTTVHSTLVKGVVVTGKKGLVVAARMLKAELVAQISSRVGGGADHALPTFGFGAG
jgi:hypothetical protein